MGLFTGKKTFNYALLRYKKSLLSEGKPDTLAVIVESNGTAMIIGRAPAGLEGVSPIGRDVLGHLPTVLRGQVEKMQPSDFSRGIIPALASANAWNLSFSEPDAIRSEAPIEEVAFMLFGRHVMKGAQIAERAARTGQPQTHTEKMELFEVAAPIAAGV